MATHSNEGSCGCREENIQRDDENTEQEARSQKAYSVSRLLGENLSKLDHVGIVIEGLRECNHSVGAILLVTVACGGKKGAECVHSDGVALTSATGSILVIRQAVNHTSVVRMGHKDGTLTQAASHCFVESEMV